MARFAYASRVMYVALQEEQGTVRRSCLTLLEFPGNLQVQRASKIPRVDLIQNCRTQVRPTPIVNTEYIFHQWWYYYQRAGRRASPQHQCRWFQKKNQCPLNNWLTVMLLTFSALDCDGRNKLMRLFQKKFDEGIYNTPYIQQPVLNIDLSNKYSLCVFQIRRSNFSSFFSCIYTYYIFKCIIKTIYLTNIL